MSKAILYAFWAPKPSGLQGLLHFKLQKHQSLFDCLFRTSQYPSQGPFWHFKDLNTCAVPCVLLYSVWKLRSCPSSRSLTSKNNSDTLFDGCFLLSTLFSCFWGILISMHQAHLCWCNLKCKYTKHTLLLCWSILKASHLAFMLLFGFQKAEP